MSSYQNLQSKQGNNITGDYIQNNGLLSYDICLSIGNTYPTPPLLPRPALPRPSTGSSYATSFKKSFILENKFALNFRKPEIKEIIISHKELRMEKIDTNYNDEREKVWLNLTKLR